MLGKPLIALGALMGSVALAGCGTSASGTVTALSPSFSPPAPPPAPHTPEAAKTTAKAYMDALMSQDYAGAWDLLEAKAQQGFSRENFVSFRTQCKPTKNGLLITFDSSRLEGADEAVVGMKALGFPVGTVTLGYENQQWRVDGGVEGAENSTAGVDKMVAQERAAGNCDKDTKKG